ncbi:hypothetical protein SEA_LILBEANIE_61 [Gordonia phage Lilbeanie]|uniref:Uncharacterized protein n=1 Tax=Gordonia phage Lilbeanie TaxID=2794947 RepID=A0A7T1KSA8_9CAUD|nr:hypothetical protein J1773_gp61 [Gordonia phage Lilbeanie]QPO17139.1 hypothetical protein SEA_LILBEANIE_61 [Gordonia phage Lilbeanie]
MMYTRKLKHGKLRIGAYRWNPHGTMPPPGLSWKPWPHRNIQRSLDVDYFEVYWPGLGGVSVSVFHHTSYVEPGATYLVRDSWIAKIKGRAL